MPPRSNIAADDPFPMNTRPPRPPVQRLPQLLILTTSIAIALLVACAAKIHDNRPPPEHAKARAGTSLIVGETAPDFTLQDVHGGKVTLSQMPPGKLTVLIFYQGYDCPRCVSHLKDLGNRRDEFEKAGAQILAISPDSIAASKDSIREFGDFPFPILSDPDKKVAAAYGVLLADDVLFHGAYVIDTHRKIRFAIRSDHPYDNSDGLLKQLERVRDYP